MCPGTPILSRYYLPLSPRASGPGRKCPSSLPLSLLTEDFLQKNILLLLAKSLQLQGMGNPLPRCHHHHPAALGYLWTSSPPSSIAGICFRFTDFLSTPSPVILLRDSYVHRDDPSQGSTSPKSLASSLKTNSFFL